MNTINGETLANIIRMCSFHNNGRAGDDVRDEILNDLQNFKKNFYFRPIGDYNWGDLNYTTGFEVSKEEEFKARQLLAADELKGLVEQLENSDQEEEELKESIECIVGTIGNILNMVFDINYFL